MARDNYQRQWQDTVTERLNDVTERLDEVTRNQQQQAIISERIEGRFLTFMTRDDIATAINTRPSREEFLGAIALLDARIKRMEDNPASQRAWLAVGIAVISALVNLLPHLK